MNNQKTNTGKCPHFDDGRPCRGCEYASDPKLYDPCCLFGHPELLEKTRDQQSRFT